MEVCKEKKAGVPTTTSTVAKAVLERAPVSPWHLVLLLALALT